MDRQPNPRLLVAVWIVVGVVALLEGALYLFSVEPDSTVLALLGPAFLLLAFGFPRTGRIPIWTVRALRGLVSIAYLALAMLTLRGTAPTPFSAGTEGAVAELLVGLSLGHRSLRPLAFALALPLHLVMLGSAVDGLGLLRVSFLTFLLFGMSTVFLDAPEAGRLVVWDDSCSFCGRWKRVFERLDLFRALRFVGLSHPEAYLKAGVREEDAIQALQLVEPDGRLHSGYSAVRRIVSVLPGGWFIAPYMAFPGVPLLGSRWYRRVAGRRTCTYVPRSGSSRRDRSRS